MQVQLIASARTNETWIGEDHDGFHIRYFQSTSWGRSADDNDSRGFGEAKVRMARLALISPGEYFIHSEAKGVVARQSQEWADII